MENQKKLLDKAIEYANSLHSGQYRKGDGTPYIFHSIRVMENVKRFKKSSKIEELMCAALLHDTLEDCEINLYDIRERFGTLVSFLVEELTTDPIMKEKLGKKEYLSEKLTNISSYALVIKLADRLDNIQDTKYMTNEFRNRYFEETKYILERIKVNRKLSPTHKCIISEIEKHIF